MYDYFKKVFIKIMMKGGNKSTAEAIFEESFLHLRKKLLSENSTKSPKELFIEIRKKITSASILKEELLKIS